MTFVKFMTRCSFTIKPSLLVTWVRRLGQPWVPQSIGLTEPLVSMHYGAIMYDYYFEEENFVVDDKDRRNHYLALVAYNVNYLVLAAMSQCKRAQGM